MIKSKKNIIIFILMVILTIVSPLSFLQYNFKNDVVAETAFDIWDGTYYTNITNDYTAIFENGDGTEANPFLIETAKQFASLDIIIKNDSLKSIYNSSNVYYKLANNLDFNNLSFNPIGLRGFNNYQPFFANLDGDLFSIKNIKIDFNADINLIGLFSVLDGATVTNMIIENFSYNYTGLVQFIDQADLGVISARAQNSSTIKNCAVNSGNITIKGAQNSTINYATRVGGVVGYAVSSTIINCTNKINLQSTTRDESVCVGGIVGLASSTIIDSCLNIGNIANFIVNTTSTGNDISHRFGGIVGETSNPVTILKCANIGNISASLNSGYTAQFLMGGLVGFNNDTYNSLTIKNSYSTSQFTVSYPSCTEQTDISTSFVIGGLVGQNGNLTSSIYSSVLENSFAYNIINVNSGSSKYVGSIFGYNSSILNILGVKYLENSYSDCGENVSTQLTNITELTEEQFTKQSNFASYNFDEIWHYENSESKHPTHKQTGFKGLTTYIVNFIVDNEIIKTISLREGLLIVDIPEDPEKNGYNFTGWGYLVDQNYVIWNFSSDNVTSNIDLVAQFDVITYKVQFYINGTLDSTLTQQITYNQKAQMPNITLPEGMQFDGWYLSASLSGTKFDFENTTILQDVKLYSKMQGVPCTVSFYVPQQTDGEIYVLHSSNTAEYGSNITSLIPSYSLQGCTINGWYDIDDLNETIIDFNSYVIKKTNLNLYLSYSINEFTITFNTTSGAFKDGSTTATITQKFGSVISAVQDPIRQDYQFDGWYTSANCNDDNFQGDAYVFTTMPAQNLTLYAKWVKGTVKIYVYAYTETSSGAFAHSSGGGSLGFGVECGYLIAQQSVNIGESAQFYAKANNGYELSGVYTQFNDNTFAGEKLTQSYQNGYYTIQTSVVTSEGLSLYAKFTKTRFTVTLLQEGDFTVTGNGTYTYGTEVTIDCTESSSGDYIFNKWVTVNGANEVFITENKSYTFTVTQSVTYIAKCKIKLTVNQAVNGTINYFANGASTTDTYFEKNTLIDIKATANYGYKFVDFQGEFTGNANEFSFYLTAPKVVTAIFESKIVTINLYALDPEHTDLSNSTNVENAQFIIGDIITLSAVAVPSDTYMFSKWKTDCTGIFSTKYATLNYKITANDVEKGTIYFEAQVKRAIVNVEIVVYGGGSIKANGYLTNTSYENTIKYQETLTIEFIANNMYYFDSILYKEDLSEDYEDYTNNVGENNILSLVAISDIYIEVYFNPLMWIDVMVEPQGQGVPSNPYKITCAEEFAYIAFAVNNGVYGTNQAYYCSYILIENDIDFSGRFWTPIGIDEDYKRFDGILDKNFVTLKNLVLLDDAIETYYGGLFGCIGTGRIINESRSVWLYVGITGTVVFGILLVVFIIINKKTKRKRKKVVVLPVELINDKNE